MASDNYENVEHPRIFTVAEGVFVRREIDNMGWIDMGGSTMVIDTLEQPAAGNEVLAAMRKTVGDQPIDYVVNTHPHPDHTALNPLFADLGAAIINARDRDLPDQGLRLQGTKRTAQIVPLPGCHTQYDCVVWLEAEKVLFVGDLFGWGLIPWMGNLKQSRKQLILDTYERLIAYQAVTVVPGHGPLCSTQELVRWRDYFRWLIEAIEDRKRQGENTASLGPGELKPPPDMVQWWRFSAWKHEDSVKKVAKAVARDWR